MGHDKGTIATEQVSVQCLIFVFGSAFCKRATPASLMAVKLRSRLQTLIAASSSTVASVTFVDLRLRVASLEVRH